jgi:hypothetical protein
VFHYGSRENPAEIRNPGDLDRAVSRVWSPTFAQVEAGNYKMAHVLIGGLPIRIEVPRDRMRTGISADGAQWSVRLTAHYGAIKRTEGADDEPIDVYIGEYAHQGHLLPVWIIDQIHADTREYDEHKALVGFIDVAAAKHAYLTAFSDGRGHERVGAVSRLTFEEFRQWLKSENTKKPILYRKSASVMAINKHYCSSTCSCRSQEKFGGYMATSDSATPGTLGKLTGIIGKALGRMTPDERATIFADAAVSTSAELGKAANFMEHGDDGGHPGRVEDQWDGAPDDELEVGGGHGPESKAPPGKVNVGPSQAASGNGAEKMEREYSRHAPQSGVQAATEKLGREIAGMRGAMKAILKALDTFNVQLETVKASTAVAPVLPDIEKMVSDAVGKAVAKAVVKAMDEKEDREEDDEDDKEDKEAAKAESESEKEEEDEDEGDDDKESAKSKSAAQLRKMAKARIAWAERRLAKSIEFAESDKPAKCEHMFALAQINLSKAAGYVESAKAIRGQVGPATKALVKSVAKLDKAIKAAPVDNQKIWPASTEKKVGTGKAVETTVSDPGAMTPADLQKAMGEIQKALDGVGIMQSSMKDMFQVISGQSRSNGVPPVLALAKGGVDDLMSREAEIIRMASDGSIKPGDVDRARDVISNIRTRAVPENILSQKISRLPPAVQDVLNRQVA